jgi:hypothetical protein
MALSSSIVRIVLGTGVSLPAILLRHAGGCVKRL